MIYINIVLNNNKVISNDNGCGCCSEDEEITIDEALQEIDDAMTELDILKTQLKIMKEGK